MTAATKKAICLAVVVVGLVESIGMAELVRKENLMAVRFSLNEKPLSSLSSFSASFYLSYFLCSLQSDWDRVVVNDRTGPSLELYLHWKRRGMEAISQCFRQVGEKRV